MPKFGVHTSIAGGIANAITLARGLRCDCLQMFVRNQRQWGARPWTQELINDWLKARGESGLAPVVVHDSYLINLANPQTRLWNRSCRALVEDLDRCQWLDVEYLVVHPGAHLGRGENEGLSLIVEGLDRLADERPAVRTTVLLETTAGQGSSLGYRFEHLATILGRVAKPDYFGVCLDTCHAFAAGYDLRNADAVGKTLDQFDAIVGLRNLHVLHVNDSKRELGSRVDRHEHIGLGQIGLEGIRAVVNEPRLAGLPMILETPKETDPKTGRDWDEINLAQLRRLAGVETPDQSEPAEVMRE